MDHDTECCGWHGQPKSTDATLRPCGATDTFLSVFDALTSVKREQLQLHGVCNLLRVTYQPMHAVTLCHWGKHVGCHISVSLQKQVAIWPQSPAVLI